MRAIHYKYNATVTCWNISVCKNNGFTILLVTTKAFMQSIYSDWLSLDQAMLWDTVVNCAGKKCLSGADSGQQVRCEWWWRGCCQHHESNCHQKLPRRHSHHYSTAAVSQQGHHLKAYIQTIIAQRTASGGFRSCRISQFACLPSVEKYNWTRLVALVLFGFAELRFMHCLFESLLGQLSTTSNARRGGGLFMSLVIHHWIGNVQDCQGVSASEMTYIVSGGALNSTHSTLEIAPTQINLWNKLAMKLKK